MTAETGAVFTLGKSYLSDTIGTVRHRQCLEPIRRQQPTPDDDQGGGGTPKRQTSSSTVSSGMALVTSVANGGHMEKPAESQCNGSMSPTSLKSPKEQQRQQQSYFFIKNDPVIKIVCGNKQSAVICGEYRSLLILRTYYQS